jgi:hypothetical protein
MASRPDVETHLIPPETVSRRHFADDVQDAADQETGEMGGNAEDFPAGSELSCHLASYGTQVSSPILD